jgi:hypothetical protein
VPWDQQYGKNIYLNRLGKVSLKPVSIALVPQRRSNLPIKSALLHGQLATLNLARQQSKAMREIEESDVEAVRAAMIDNLPELDRIGLKDLLRGLVERITLGPKKTLACCKIKLNLGELVASPRGFEPLYSP